MRLRCSVPWLNLAVSYCRVCRLPCRLPAIDGKYVAGNKGRLVGGKENEGVGDLIGLSHAAERHARDETGLSFGVAGKAIEYRGLDWPRCYRIDANAQARDLERRRFGEPLDCVLAGGIDRRSAGTVVVGVLIVSAQDETGVTGVGGFLALLRSGGNCCAACSPGRISLAWRLAKPVVTSVVIGAKRLDQLQDNLAAIAPVCFRDRSHHLEDLL